ncbi:MAG: hypothetical protein AB8G96_06040 [Phycisphaerales bacterium]
MSTGHPSNPLGETAPTSLTGTEWGAPRTHRSSVSIALGQLRAMVGLCCTLLMLALIVQGVVFTAAAYGGMRYERLAAGVGTASEAPESVLMLDESRVNEADFDPLGERIGMNAPEPADVNFVRSTLDHVFMSAADIAAAFGRLAMAALMPLLVLGVLLAAGSATDGVEKTVTSFVWAVLSLFLVFPIAARFGMPWEGGALWGYSTLAGTLDGATAVGAAFFVQYMVLPIAAFGTVGVTWQKFSAGVRAGLIRKENFELDPELEREAANIRPGSNFGSRAARAMDEIGMGADGGPVPPGVMAPPPLARVDGTTTAAAATTAAAGSSSDQASSPDAGLRPTGTDGPPADDASPRRLI